MGLHADPGASPQPWSRTALAANADRTLTDYTREAGRLAFVRGSLIMFHGATGRGAFPHPAPGMRRG